MRTNKIFNNKILFYFNVYKLKQLKFMCLNIELLLTNEL